MALTVANTGVFAVCIVVFNMHFIFPLFPNTCVLLLQTQTVQEALQRTLHFYRQQEIRWDGSLLFQSLILFYYSTHTQLLSVTSCLDAVSPWHPITHFSSLSLCCKYPHILFSVSQTFHADRHAVIQRQ